jgi:hypothetical protein
MARRTNKQIAADKAASKKTVIVPKAEAPKSEILGVVSRYAGTVISINLKKGAYYGVGDVGKCKLWLDSENWTCKIPDNLSEQESMQVQGALERNTIVIGKHYLPALIKEEGIREEYAKLVKLARTMTQDVKKPFIDLVRMTQVGNWTPLEIYTYCLDQERTTRGRREWIDFLKEAIANYNGPDFLVEDFVDDPDNYDIVIDPNVGIVKDSRGNVKKDDLHIEYSDPSLATASPQVAAAALDKYLN